MSAENERQESGGKESRDTKGERKVPWDHLGKVLNSVKDSLLEQVLTNWRPEW